MNYKKIQTLNLSFRSKVNSEEGLQVDYKESK